MSRFLVVPSLFFALAACGSTASSVPELSAEEHMAQFMQRVQVAEGHGLLNVLEGSFAAKITSYMGPDEPASVTEGVMENRLILGGRFLESRFRSEIPGMGSFEGHGLLGYNTFDDRYESVWIDSMNTALPNVGHGHLEQEGRVLVTESNEYDYFEERFVKRRTVTRINDRRSHTFTMYKTSADGQEFVELMIEYSRL